MMMNRSYMLLHCRCWLVLLSLMLLRPCATAAVVDEKIHHFDSAPWKEQISIANEMLLEFHREGLTDELIQFSNKSHPDSVRMCVMYWAAEHYYAAQDYDEAVTLAEKALPLSRGADKANRRSLLSLAYCRQGSYEQAASYALKCYQLDKATGDPDLMSSSLNTLAGIYIGANRPQDAEQYILKGIEMARQANNPARTAVLLGMASETYHALQQDEKSLRYAQDAYDIEEKLGHADRAAVRLTQQASALIGLERYAQAEENLRRAMPVLRASTDRHSLALALNKLGKALLAQKRAKEAIPFYHEAAAILRSMGDLGNEMHACRGLYEAYWDINRDSAKVALDRFDYLKDSLYSHASAESLARFNAEFGNDLLQEQNELQRERTRRIVVISLLGVVAVAVVLWWLLRRRYKMREAALQAIIDGLKKSKDQSSGIEGAEKEMADASETPVQDDFLVRLVDAVARRKEISVEELASEMCITRGQLNRRVKALTGVTTQQYVARIRLEHGRSLLHDTPLAVAEVAYRCGFDDAATFSRAFRRAFGQSPTSYRATVQKKAESVL